MDQYEPLAVAGYKSSGGDVIDDYQPELRGERGRKTIRQMTNDSTIAAYMLGVSSIYSSLPWFVDPADKDDPIAVDAAEWLRATLFDHMGDPEYKQPDDTWSAFVQSFHEVDAFGWGYYDVQTKQLEDGTEGIARLIPIAPESLYEWDIDERGYVHGLTQQSPRTFRYIPIPTTRALHLVSVPYKGSPEGRSIFRAAYRDWYYKTRAMEQEAILHDRGAGFPVLYVHADVKRQAMEKTSTGQSTDRAKAAQSAMDSYGNMVRDIKRNQQSGAVVYFDTVKDVSADGGVTNTDTKTVELQLLSSESTPADIDKTIRRLDASLGRAVLADFMFFNTDGGSGNSGGLTVRVELFHQSLTGLLERKVETINRQLIPMLWKLNPGFERWPMPKIRAGVIQREKISEVLKSLEVLSRAGFPVAPDPLLQEHAYKELGLPTDNIDPTATPALDPLE
jgi:hypothetical protein